MRHAFRSEFKNFFAYQTLRKIWNSNLPEPKIWMGVGQVVQSSQRGVLDYGRCHILDHGL